MRRKLARLVKEGKKKHLHQGLIGQLSNSASTWKGIKNHLGWDSQVGPESLIVKKGDGRAIVERLVTTHHEVAEEMVLQYERKN